MVSLTPEVKKNIQDVFEFLYRRKWYIVVATIIGIGAGIGTSLWLPKEYRSTTMIMVERQQVPESYVRSTVTSSISDRLKTISQQVLSRTNLLRLNEDFGLYGKGVDNTGSDNIIANLREKIEVKLVGKQAFSLSFSGEDPETAMNVTSRLASGFINENLKIREQQAEVTTEFLKSELGQAKKRMDKLDKNLRIFKERNRGKLPGELQTNLRTLDRLQLSLQSNLDRLPLAEEGVIRLEKQIAELESELLQTGHDFSQSPRAKNEELEKLKSELANLAGVYKENFPDVIILREKIKRLENKSPRLDLSSNEKPNTVDLIKNNEQYRHLQEQHKKALTLLLDLKEKGRKISTKIGDYEKRVEQTPMLEVQWRNLNRDYDISQRHYETLLGKTISAGIAENLERRQRAERFRIIDPANFPEKPFKPNTRKLIMVGTFAGVASGVGLALLMEILNPCFRKPEDFEGLFAYPLLATIPKFERKKNSKLLAFNRMRV